MDEEEPTSPLLKWMSAHGSEDLERQPVNLAHRMIFLGLGSIHRTASQAAHALHDIIARLELVELLREELEIFFLQTEAGVKVT